MISICWVSMMYILSFGLLSSFISTHQKQNQKRTRKCCQKIRKSLTVISCISGLYADTFLGDFCVYRDVRVLQTRGSCVRTYCCWIFHVFTRTRSLCVLFTVLLLLSMYSLLYSTQYFLHFPSHFTCFRLAPVLSLY